MCIYKLHLHTYSRTVHTYWYYNYIYFFHDTVCEQTKKMDVYVESKVFDDELITRQPAFAEIRGMLFTFKEG